MTKRLEAILSYISGDGGVIDVGTDHGYIPVELALNGYKGKIIASDINPGPLGAAKRTAAENGVSDRIEFLLSDGLDGCAPGSVENIIIAGMGGDQISQILDRAEWTMSSGVNLILQPMTKAEVLRFWLVNNGYEIQTDYLIKDFGKLYSVINARYTGRNTALSDAELFSGAYEHIKNNGYFTELMNSLAERMLRIINGLTMSGADGYITDFYNNILNEVTEMKSR